VEGRLPPGGRSAAAALNVKDYVDVVDYHGLTLVTA
jgi:hypothetical protein